jgi:hypothetical protein
MEPAAYQAHMAYGHSIMASDEAEAAAKIRMTQELRK